MAKFTAPTWNVKITMAKLTGPIWNVKIATAKFSAPTWNAHFPKAKNHVRFCFVKNPSSKQPEPSG
ncbi:MAG: hypothetical protein IJ244_05935 [Bacteroidaceae bacterium]|nr:hypothetical protein [Bacteroidaceae bacterium]